MTLLTCTNKSVGLERVHYFPRQLITADDMTAEQYYFRQKLRRHNRFLHGWGVVCGCDVELADNADRPWQVWVCPGYVVGPQGDEICIGEPFLFDLAEGRSTAPCEHPRPCPPTGRRSVSDALRPVYLAIRYAECDSRPVRVHPVGCACDEAACEYSRIRDDFELTLLPELPASHQQAAEADQQWCAEIRMWVVDEQKGPAPVPRCPQCPDDPWVVLACIMLPEQQGNPIISITYEGRRVLYSTTALHQVITCWHTDSG